MYLATVLVARLDKTVNSFLEVTTCSPCFYDPENGVDMMLDFY